MIFKHYGLCEQPFGATPNPQFLFAGRIHREALASLLYAIESGRGFTALIAPPGLGKTTLLFHLLGVLRGKAKTAFVFQTQCKPRELLRFLLKEFGVNSPSADFVAMHHALNDMLAAEAMAGRKCVIVLDEAHNLSDDTLESVRLLSDFETPNRKLLHIVLAGQLELRERLLQPSLAQLTQRIGVVCKLGPLTAKEVDEYIQHRLKTAGYSGPPLFTPAAMAVIREFSHGIPRNINALCFSAMSLGFALGRIELDAQILEEAVADLSLEESDTEAYADEQEVAESFAASRLAPEMDSKSSEIVVANEPDNRQVDASTSTLGPTSSAEPQTPKEPVTAEPVQVHVSSEASSGQGAAAPMLSAAKVETKDDAQPAHDPLQNIDLSSYALLDGIPARKKPAGEDDGLHQSSPWIATATPRSQIPEPELDVLKQRLANHTYPEQAAANARPRDFVIVGLLATVFGVAVLAALVWVRPNIGLAMGRSQSAAPVVPTPQVTPVQTERRLPKQGARKKDVTPLLVTSSAVRPIRFDRHSESLPIEDTAPPAIPLDDQGKIQQLQAVMSPSSTEARVGTTSLSKNVLERDSEAINNPNPIAMMPPVYPEAAKQERLEGTVVLQIVVDKNGKVKRLERISGHPQLADAAIRAVSHWRYLPSIVNGRAVESFKQVEMDFRLGEAGPSTP